MLSIYNIWTIARFETKTLLRSWFFRIFSGISIGILAFLSVMIFSGAIRPPWFFRGIPSSIPYVNILLLNVTQAVVAIFLSSEFLKRDKNLDTTEVVYMRSMTNGDYVLGKTAGILFVFLLQNLAVLLAAAIINIFFSDVPFALDAYLLYPLLISVPTLVFILGLSFLFMVLIRNQAVTFIVLLGYIAVTLFFLGPRFHHIFDYMGFNIPLMRSDFVGFGNVSAILTHRGIYFLLGLCFISITILLLKRLPQSRPMTNLSRILAIMFLAGAIYLVNAYLSGLSAGKNLRQRMVDLNDSLIEAPRVSLKGCDLAITHLGHEIEAEARLVVENNTPGTIDRYVFNLNPGLVVEQVTGNDGSSLGFERTLHILTVDPTMPLVQGMLDSVRVIYRGKINENGCYLDIDEESREEPYRKIFFNMDKRYCFTTADYMLLTPENLWYPTACQQYSSHHTHQPTQDFTEFRLEVKTSGELTAVSQGISKKTEEGKYLFVPGLPLPGLSLAIGQYEHRSTTVDSISYNLFTLEKHDYFTPYFTEMGDTLQALIRELKEDYERRLEISYPYQRLTLVEVPVQFFGYRRLWTIRQETVQPEIVLLPEKGVLLSGADFSRPERRGRGRREPREETETNKEKQGRQFQRFVTSTIAGDFRKTPWQEEMFLDPGIFNIFPNYFTFINHIKSEEWPVFNMALESFIASHIEAADSPFLRFLQGTTDEEKTNLALAENNLPEILADPEKQSILNDALQAKGTHLFMMLQNKLGAEVFSDYLSNLLESNRFRVLNCGELISDLNSKLQFDFEPYIKNWYESRDLPGFLIADTEAYTVLDRDRTRFQVRFKVSNTEPVEGILLIYFMSRGPRFSFSRAGGEPEIRRTIYVDANQTKEIGIVLDYSPRIMVVNTMISKNLPVSLDKRFADLELSESAEPFEGERILDRPIMLGNPGEIIVDNEDEGFEVFDRPSKNILRKMFSRASKEQEERYVGLRSWGSLNRWRAATHTDFYGRYIRSAHITKAGKGETKVAWNVEIPESGYYEIHCYAIKYRFPFMRREQTEYGRYHYLVHNDDGIDEVTLDMNNAQDGWNFLGSYYISAGKSKVEMTNESTGRMVIADAVKWVKR